MGGGRGGKGTYASLDTFMYICRPVEGPHQMDSNEIIFQLKAVVGGITLSLPPISECRSDLFPIYFF